MSKDEITFPRADASDAVKSERGERVKFPIVGLGASVGGLEALQQLLQELPPNMGMAFVVIQHLSPDHTSFLPDILARSTSMPVAQVVEEVEVEPGHLYVISPGCDMVIAEGRLKPVAQTQQWQHRGIDCFFRSLAQDAGHLAIGVVLSGALDDGTVGLEEIKFAGGVTFAQDNSAQHDSMPRSAIAAGCVDFVLPPKGIAEELARIAQHPYILLKLEPEDTSEPPNYKSIIETIRLATGLDFTHYKANTLHRRITRRMMLQKLEAKQQYEEYLNSTPHEVEELYQDILISVTSFFRDPESYAALASDVFPKLIAAAQGEPVRIWVAGCSSGEEVYSIAMTFMECLEAGKSSSRLQLFATDVNPRCIEKARAGFYPKSIANEVSPKRLQHFFQEEGGGYRVRKAIREMCIFSRHNLLTDPPFSRVDFISCRNLLIYLQSEVQQRVFKIFHYALRPHGRLWLGASESVGHERLLFEACDVRHKFFKRRSNAEPFTAARAQGATSYITSETAGPLQPGHGSLSRDAERLVLTKYAPPGVVVSIGLDIVQYQGDVGPYLAPAPGSASHHLLKMLGEGLAGGVLEAIQRADREGVPVRSKNLRMRNREGIRNLAVEVIPIKAQANKGGGFVVLFDENRRPPITSLRRWDPGVWWRKLMAFIPRRASARDEEVLHLTQELAATRESLQALSEQHEAVTEELRSANEEAQSANEEMQSINEELETSKEEMEASNEELATVNEELGERNRELKQLNDELRAARDFAEHLLQSVPKPIVVLDAALRVKRASTAFYSLMRLAPKAVIGQHIYELGDILGDAMHLRKMLGEIIPEQRSISDYEILQNIEGLGQRVLLINAHGLAPDPEAEPLIFLIIQDITLRKEAEAALRGTDALFSTLIEQAPGAMFVVDRDFKFRHLNRRTAAIFGPGDLTGRPVGELMEALWGADESASILQIFQRTFETGERYVSPNFDRKRLDTGVVESYEWEIQRLSFPSGGYGLVGYFSDITERRRLEASLMERAQELARADRSKDEFLAMLAHELRNPLAPISNASHILQTASSSDEERRESLHMIDRQIENMSRMIDDLLDVSRITEGKIELRKKVVSLNDIIAASVNLNRASCTARSQELSVSLPSEPIFVNADSTRMEQVFSNLLSNASKYAGDGCHIWLEVELAARQATPQVIVRVRDDGIGIDAELLPRIFDLFVQATRALDRSHGGLGIGLTLVQRLVKLHGGTVEAHSAGIGQGSEFIVCLPIMVNSPLPSASSSAEQAVREPSRRILIVDDNIDGARSLAILQSRRGHVTRTAFDGVEAISAAIEFQPEVVLLDIGLPGLNGFEVARKLRSMPAMAGTFLIALSGYNSDKDREEAKRAGFDEYMVKPPDLGLIRQWLRTRISRPELLFNPGTPE